MRQQCNEHAFTTMQAAAPATVKKVSQSAAKDNVENWAKIEAKTDAKKAKKTSGKDVAKSLEKLSKKYARPFGLFLLKKYLQEKGDENWQKLYNDYIELSNGGRLRRASKDETADATISANRETVDKDGNEKTESFKTKTFVETDDVDYREIAKVFVDCCEVFETQKKFNEQKETRIEKAKAKAERAKAERANVLKSVTAADLASLDPTVLESLKKLLNA